MIDAAADFHARALAAEPDPPRQPDPDWHELIEKSRQALRLGDFPNSQHWNDFLKKVQRALPRLADAWAARPFDSWCHGDLHPGNCMIRTDSGQNAPVLIDLDLVRPGCWIEDALYLERQFWGRPDDLYGIKPVNALRKARETKGLRTDGDLSHLVNVRRVLAAAASPALAGREGGPNYFANALATAQTLLPRILP